MTKSTNIIEIFSSIQGEGPYIGCRQIFIRFAGCNLNCNYCDTLFNPQDSCNIYQNELKRLKNPVSTHKLLEEILNLNKIDHNSISLTGGEPLLNIEFLTDFLPKFSKIYTKTKIYLETNGILFEELEKIIENIDIISMDLKLESSTGVDFPFEKHKKFIQTAMKFKKEIFTKAVITSKISDEEIKKISDFLISLDKKILLILQPVSSENKELLLSAQNILKIQKKFLKKLNNVRVIPQTHKFLDLL